MAFFITGKIILLTEMLGKRSKFANLMFLTVTPMLFECFSNIP